MIILIFINSTAILDAYSNPHSIKCGHVFCSECIRKHMDPHYHLTRINSNASAGKCPICQDVCTPHDLRIERTLAEVISTYGSIRKTLLELVEGNSSDSLDDITIKRSTSNLKSNYIDLVDSDVKKPPPVIVSKLSFMQTKNLNLKAMKECLLNVVIKTMKASTKINAEGDKDALERRYRELIHLHNAQIGSDTPLTVNQIVSEINKREKARSDEFFKSKSSLKKIETLKSGNIGIFKDDWSRLIKKIHDNKKKSENDNNNAEYCWDHWRVVMSEKVGKPFFYNTITNVGQFEIPNELESNDVSSNDIISSNHSQNDNKFPVLLSTLVCEIADDDDHNGDDSKIEMDATQSNYTFSLNNTMNNTAGDFDDKEMSIEKTGTCDEIIAVDDNDDKWSCSSCTYVNGNFIIIYIFNIIC